MKTDLGRLTRGDMASGLLQALERQAGADVFAVEVRPIDKTCSALESFQQNLFEKCVIAVILCVKF